MAQLSWSTQGLLLFNQLSKKLPYTLSGFPERPASGSCNAIHTAHTLSGSFLAGPQITTLLEPMKYWVQSSGTDFVSMASQFFGHSRAKDQLLIRMVQDVEPDHPGIEIAIIVHHWRPFSKTP
jgi:hypothetical protein